MSKKNIAISAVLGVASLGLVAPALANYNDGYVQAPVPIATASPYATSDAGFVIGLEGGYADTHWDNLESNAVSVSGTGFAGRAFLGYDFNQYFGVETGYIYLPTAEFRGKDGTPFANMAEDINNYAFDLLGKISIPVTSGLKLYAKAGVGYLHSGTALFNDDSTSHVGPAFGVGAGYEVVPNLTINLSWMRYSGDGKLNGNGNYQPNPDAVLLGLSYKFPTRG